MRHVRKLATPHCSAELILPTYVYCALYQSTISGVCLVFILAMEVNLTLVIYS